jgi:hypothetical protein
VTLGFRGLLLAGFLAVTVSAAPSHAQEVPDGIEAVIDPSLQVDSGLALARRQMADADLLGAVATLERVLLAHDDADAGRLLYAGLLCRLDDAAGADVELRLLAGRGVADDGWAELIAACGPRDRPMPRVLAAAMASPQ